MGQKVHPIGFRVGITKPYQSQWYARFQKYQYSQTIIEDRLLRQTVLNLVPKLMKSLRFISEDTNSAASQSNAGFKNNVKKTKKREENMNNPITHIKIERGLIPYQIGIQIHAENCEILKNAIQASIIESSSTKSVFSNSKLTEKGNDRSKHLFLKAHNYLSLLKIKPAFIEGSHEHSPTTNPSINLQTDINVKNDKNLASQISFLKIDKGLKKRTKSLLKKLQKRKEIQRSLLILQKKPRSFRGAFFDENSSKSVFLPNNTPVHDSELQFNSAALRSNAESTTLSPIYSAVQSSVRSKDSAVLSKSSTLSIGEERKRSTNFSVKDFRISRQKYRSYKKTKILNIFLEKTQKNFLKHLKQQIQYWNNRLQNNVTTPSLTDSSAVRAIAGSNCNIIGYNKRWNFIETAFVNQPIHKITKLISFLEKKAQNQMEKLRYDYIATGPLSKNQTLNYYQVIRFLKLLKTYKTNYKNVINPQKNILGNWEEKTIQHRLNNPNKNNIEQESSKIQFIQYFKNIVQKHRKDNIFYYLSTIADARKNLRKVREFTKQHKTFLFGLSNNQLINKSVIRKALLSTANSEGIVNTFDRSSIATQGCKQNFLKQVEKQKKIYEENCQLIPKISLKFYTVPSTVIQIKASVVADTIVDALEKRQAFRKVIKDAKKALLKNTRVKGVKIQAAGRLNGAEIARTEWVRSGRVPLQTLTANIDYSYKTAKTIYGIIGVKVWIFKGYTNIIA